MASWLAENRHSRTILLLIPIIASILIMGLTIASVSADTLPSFLSSRVAAGATGATGKVLEPKTECSDGINNDGDGLIDYPNDPGCSSREDNSENDCISDSDCSAVRVCFHGNCIQKIEATPGSANRAGDGRPAQTPDQNLAQQQDGSLDAPPYQGIAYPPGVSAQTESPQALSDEASSTSGIASYLLISLCIAAIIVLGLSALVIAKHRGSSAAINSSDAPREARVADQNYSKQKELEGFFMRAQAAGYSLSQIQQALVSRGWGESQAKSAIQDFLSKRH